MNGFKNTDEYIKSFPASIQKRLKEIRRTIKSAAPQAQEAIKYGIPTFVLNGNLVHFGGFKTHIGFFPGPWAVEEYKKQLVGLEVSKGTIRLPLDKPLPLKLIKNIVRDRVQQNMDKAGKTEIKPIKKKATRKASKK